jgi:methylmalonyl-CoA mutase N-terminal domain/subunit
MYRGRVWTMRQYAGFGSAAETNARFRYLLDHGQTGLSVAFDLPTQMGYDSDHQMAAGEVGKVGVAIDSLADMRRLFDGIPLDQVSTSMTINAPAAVLLLLYQLVGEEQGVDGAALTGTVQNDVLKEYIARGTYIYPPKPSLRITTDLFSYCAEQLPRFNTISISGYHMAEAGATAVQEVAFTLANAVAYVQAALDAGLDVDAFGPRLAFFFVARTTLFEEAAKFRAARRIWADTMATRFGADNPRSRMLRFHTQTAGVQLTAQQPLNNVVRVAVQALAAVLGGTQSLHTNAFDEALALPSEAAARLALRSQQVLANEVGLTDTVDPLAGSYFVERLTDEVDARVRELMARVDELGGAVAAIERGFQKEEIERSAYAQQQPAPARPGHRRGAGQVPGRRALPPRPGRRPGRPRRPRRRRPRQRQPAGADAGGAPEDGHRRRGLRRAPRGVRHLPPARLPLTCRAGQGADQTRVFSRRPPGRPRG